jgi:hypothetical protein
VLTIRRFHQSLPYSLIEDGIGVGPSLSESHLLILGIDPSKSSQFIFLSLLIRTAGFSK